MEGFSEQLKGLLPLSKPSDESDIRHLANAAASSVNTFVTRDRALLQKSKEIGDLTGLEVINPVDLIVRMHELTEQQSYIPDRIAGLSLRWERLKSGDLASLPLESFSKMKKPKEDSGKSWNLLSPTQAVTNANCSGPVRKLSPFAYLHRDKTRP